MSMNDQAEFMAGLKRMIKSVKNNIDLYEVVSYTVDENAGTQDLQVRQTLEKNTQHHVIVNGVGLGNNKGIVTGYEVGDILVCLNLRGKLIILSSIYNQFYSQKDSFVLPLEKEIILKAASGAYIQMTNDGGFKILNKNGEGVIMDENDNITITAKYIDINQID